MRIKTISFLIFIIVIAISCSKTSKLIKLQKSYIPAVVSNIYIGIPLTDFKKIRAINNLSVNDGEIITYVKEEYNKDSIPLIHYQFGHDKKLYEIIIEYDTIFHTKEKYIEKYGTPNNGKEWLITLDKTLKLKIWVYQNRLCIADSKYFKN